MEHLLAPWQERADLDLVERRGFFTKRHLPAVGMKALVGPDRWDRLWTFGLVRHPYAWFTSQLTYNLRNRGLSVPRDRLLTPADVQRCFDILVNARGQAASPTGTQWAFLCDENQQPLTNAVVPLEKLRALWPELCARLDIPAPPLVRLNSVGHPHWKDWLSAEAMAAVDRLYGEDWDLYNEAGRKAGRW
ncbi:hypothetical protein ACWGKQ_08680 [Streptomyces sp. NPDC054770]